MRSGIGYTVLLDERVREPYLGREEDEDYVEEAARA